MRGLIRGVIRDVSPDQPLFHVLLLFRRLRRRRQDSLLPERREVSDRHYEEGGRDVSKIKLSIKASGSQPFEEHHECHDDSTECSPSDKYFLRLSTQHGEASVPH